MIAIQKTQAAHAMTLHVIEQELFSDPWSIDDIIYETMQEYSICFVAMDDATTPPTIAGHVSMRHIINEGYISNLAVSKAYQKQGIGSMLMDALFEAAADRQMVGLTLEVRISNKPAIALYTKFGFQEEGIRKNYYTKPREDALVLWRYF